jgi:hypothetical protein
MSFKDVIIYHGHILPTVNVARPHLFGLAKLMEDRVYLIVKGKHSEAVVIKIRNIRIYPRLNELKDILGKAMSFSFSIRSIYR